jgi:LPXTG-site transpeptidase (sortase) family protein
MQQQIIKKTVIVLSLITTIPIIILVVFFFGQNKTPADPVLISDNVVNIVTEKIEKIILPNVIAQDLTDRLKISVINVDAIIESLGILSNGEMATPEGPNNVSWYNLGPKPGEIGSAVIAGHYGWKNNIPAVFDDLNKLKVGDKISIQNIKGGELVFVVSEVHTFGEHEDASRVFISSDNKAHLNLITCGGIWDKVSKSYSKRFVVFADKV